MTLVARIVIGIALLAIGGRTLLREIRKDFRKEGLISPWMAQTGYWLMVAGAVCVAA